MPTYGPDGSIRLDTTVNAGGWPSSHGTGTPAPVYSDGWFRENYSTLDGLAADRAYEDYDPHFRYGWDAAGRLRGRTFDDAERDLEHDWRAQHADRDWRDYRSAVRHAFERAMHVFEGEPDPDRRR